MGYAIAPIRRLTAPMRRRGIPLLLLILLCGSTASAGSADTPHEARPNEASGLEHEEEAVGNSLRWVPRAILFIPRWALEIPFAIPRGATYLYDRYLLKDRARQIFFNDAGTMGLFPTAFFETGFGLNMGLRLIHRDLFGHGEKLSTSLGYGGRWQQRYSLKLDSGDLFGPRISAELDAGFEVQPKAKFFGLGNSRHLVNFSGEAMSSPQVGRSAVKTRYRESLGHADAGLRVAVVKHVAVRMAAGWTMREFGKQQDSDEDEIDLALVYPTSQLIGFDDGVNTVHGSMRLIYDSRERANSWVSIAVPSGGWHAEIYGQRARGVDGDQSNFGRVGLDAAAYVNLYAGDRILVLRAHVETITGSPKRVPFSELPRLGGAAHLRGFDADRFRDRAVTLGSAEYNYPLNEYTSAYIFADVGRVFGDLSDFNLEGYRYGFGAGLQAHTLRTFLVRFHVAGSRDGVFFATSIDPLFAHAPQTEW